MAGSSPTGRASWAQAAADLARRVNRRERLEGALAESGRGAGLGLQSPSTGANMGVVIAGFAIGVLTGAVGLLLAAWLSAP